MFRFSFSKMHVIVKAWTEGEGDVFNIFTTISGTECDSYVRTLLNYRTILRFTFLSAFMLHFFAFAS